VLEELDHAGRRLLGGSRYLAGAGAEAGTGAGPRSGSTVATHFAAEFLISRTTAGFTASWFSLMVMMPVTPG